MTSSRLRGSLAGHHAQVEDSLCHDVGPVGSAGHIQQTDGETTNSVVKSIVSSRGQLPTASNWHSSLSPVYSFSSPKGSAQTKRKPVSLLKSRGLFCPVQIRYYSRSDLHN